MMEAVPDLQTTVDLAFTGIERVAADFVPQLTLREVGTITSVSDGIAVVSGLPGVGYDELIRFPGDLFGIAAVLGDELALVCFQRRDFILLLKEQRLESEALSGKPERVHGGERARRERRQSGGAQDLGGEFHGSAERWEIRRGGGR